MEGQHFIPCPRSTQCRMVQEDLRIRELSLGPVSLPTFARSRASPQQPHQCFWQQSTARGKNTAEAAAQGVVQPECVPCAALLQGHQGQESPAALDDSA